MHKLFSGPRHKDFNPLSLKSKSREGVERPSNQHGYTCAAGKKWSAIVNVRDVKAEHLGALPDFFNVVVTIARRDDKGTVLIDGHPDVKIHEIPIQRLQLENPEFKFEDVIEDAIAEATKLHEQASVARERTLNVLKDLGVTLAPMGES